MLSDPSDRNDYMGILVQRSWRSQQSVCTPAYLSREKSMISTTDLWYQHMLKSTWLMKYRTSVLWKKSRNMIACITGIHAITRTSIRNLMLGAKSEKVQYDPTRSRKEVQERTNSIRPAFEESEKYPIWLGKRRRSHTERIRFHWMVR